MSFRRSPVVDIGAWMARADELVKIIEGLVSRNLPDSMNSTTVDPQQNAEVAMGVVELGYRDVRHFCESFPAKFHVNHQSGHISLKRNPSQETPVMNYTNRNTRPVEDWTAKVMQLRSDIEHAIAYNRGEVETQLNVDPDRNVAFVSAATALGYRSVKAFCQNYPEQFVINPQTGVITARNPTQPREVKPFPPTLQDSTSAVHYFNPQTAHKTFKTPTRMQNNDYFAAEPMLGQPVFRNTPRVEAKIHFKLTHAGVTRRFALSRDEADLLAALKARVLKITVNEVALFWKDEDSLIVLECADDLQAAADYAETQNKQLPCVALETKESKNEDVEMKEEVKAKVPVTCAESQAAFNGFAFMCDACDCYLAPSNGGRFKCTLCDNYDLCADCLAKGAHDNHAFVRLLNGETEVPLSNELGGVLSMQTRDSARCTPTFLTKSPGMKDAKVLIDVINSVGAHVGKKMYDTAEWLKKEAGKKMEQSREEAEIAEQKMVEEIIRRERELEGEKWRKRREEARNQARQAAAEKEVTASAADAKTRLEQLEKDRRMAEQMWREEKRQWKGTRKQFKREAKDLRRAEKWAHKTQKHPAPSTSAAAAAVPASEQQKPDEKPNPVQQFLEAIITPPQFNRYVELSDSSSEDSDMEMLEKPTEKNDSIVSDLVDLGNETAAAQQPARPSAPAPAAAPAAAEDAPVASLTKQLGELLQEQQAAQSLGSSHAERERAFAAALQQQPAAAAPQLTQLQQVQQSQQSIYPQLPDVPAEPPRRVYPTDTVFVRDDERRSTRYRGGEGWMREDERQLNRQAEEAREERRNRYRELQHGFDLYDRDDEPAYERFNRGRSMVDEGMITRDELAERIRESRRARAAERAEMRQKEQAKADEHREKYDQAQKLPALMEIALLNELVKEFPEKMEVKLSENCRHLERNAFTRTPHQRVFTENERFDNELVSFVAENLLRRLRTMQRIVSNSHADNRARMIANRLMELRNEEKSLDKDDKFDYQAKAKELATILLTSQFSLPPRTFPSFGGFPMPANLGDLGQGINQMLEQTGLSQYLSGLMVPPAGQSPSAFTSYAPFPPPPMPPTAPAAPAAPTAPAAASAPSLTSDSLTGEQNRLLRQLFETGMFDDYDKMVKVCRKAADIHEAIDMMLGD